MPTLEVRTGAMKIWRRAWADDMRPRVWFILSAGSGKRRRSRGKVAGLPARRNIVFCNDNTQRGLIEQSTSHLIWGSQIRRNANMTNIHNHLAFGRARGITYIPRLDASGHNDAYVPI